MFVDRDPITPPQVGADRFWNESQLCWWYDVQQGISGFQRIAHLPNDPPGRAQIWSGVYTVDGHRYRRCDEIRFDPTWREGGAYRAEGLEFTHTKAGVQTRYDSAECTIDLNHVDLHPAVDTVGRPINGVHPDTQTWSAFGHDQRDARTTGHVEASGHVSGEVRLGDRRYTVDALGYRDHSWNSRRDLSGFWTTFWTNGTVGEDCSFGMSRTNLSNGTVLQRGHVVRGDTLLLAENIDMAVTIETDALCWRSAHYVLSLEDGSEVVVEMGPSRQGLLMNSREWLAYESPGPVRINGVEGAGNLEMALNPRGGLAMPRSFGKAIAFDGLSYRNPDLPPTSGLDEIRVGGN